MDQVNLAREYKKEDKADSILKSHEIFRGNNL